MPAKGKQKSMTGAKQERMPLRAGKGAARGAKAPAVKAASSGGPVDLTAEVKRLAREVEAIKAEFSQRPSGGYDGGAARRDQDKVVADRLARLDEKVEAVWNRVADLEERLEGDSAGHGHDADDFDDVPEKDFYER